MGEELKVSGEGGGGGEGEGEEGEAVDPKNAIFKQSQNPNQFEFRHAVCCIVFFRSRSFYIRSGIEIP